MLSERFRNPRLAVIAAVVPLIVVGAALFRYAKHNHQIDAAHRQRAELAEGLVEQGKRAYAAIGVTDISGLHSADDVYQLIRSMPFGGQVELSSASREKLLRHFAAFVYHRFASPSIDEYIAWRHSEGYDFVPRGDLVRKWAVGSDYESLFGTALPENASSEALFRKFWTDLERRQKDVDRPRAIAIEPAGLAGSVSRMKASNPDLDLLQGDLGAGMWHGVYNATFRNWWSPPHRMAELLSERGEATVALVGAIVEFADGSRRPLVATFTYSPADDRWFIEKLTEYNFPIDQLVLLEY